MKEVKVPVLPESINEATVAAWHKKLGDYVEVDDVIVEIETDKVVLEVPAEEAGILKEILAEEGETVNAQQVLALLDDDAEMTAEKTEAPKEIIKEAPKEEAIESPVAASEEPPEINLQENVQEEPIHSPEPSSSQPMSNRMEERVPMNRIRKTIAKRLHSATQSTAMLTTFNEVDMTGIMQMRKENQEDFQSRYGIKLGFMSFFVKACVAALKMYPSVNAEIDGDEIIYKNYYNMSFAVGTEKGLVVPVLRDADQLSFADIEKNIKTISEKARDGKITIEDLQGGTFTISNGGVYGSMLSTPILNLPQSGVLGMHNIVERPMVVDGEIKIRPIMYLALSYDHRIIDGKESVSFLKMVKENLEDPRRLFLNI